MNKKLLSFCILSALFVSAQDQSAIAHKGGETYFLENVRLSKEAHQYSKSTFSNDGNSFVKKDSTVQYGWEKQVGGWLEASKVIYKHDASGTLTTALFYATVDLTGTWEPTGKATFEYSEAQHLSFTGFIWDKSNLTWINSWKNETFYDMAGNCTKETNAYWDVETSAWAYYYNHEQTFDAQNHKTGDFYYNWIENAWKGYHKQGYTYDAAGVKISETSFNWDEASNDWIAKSKYLLENTEEKYFNWDATQSQWILYYKNKLVYNAKNLLIEKSGWYYNALTDTFIPSEKSIFTYNAAGLKSQAVDYALKESLWVKTNKRNYIYDSQGKLLDEYSYFWNKAGLTWLPSYKSTFTYDLNYLTQENHYFWSSTEQQWVSTFKNTYANDDFGNVIEKIDYTTNAYTHEYNAYWKELNFYSNSTVTDVDAAKIKKGLLGLYPNPTSDLLYCNNDQVSEIKIFNMYGQTILVQSINPTQAIDVTSLQPGIYRTVAQQGEHVITSEFIKK